MYWYYVHGQQRVGPVTHSQMEDLIRRGVVHRETPVWTEGMERWGSAGRRPELPPARPPYPERRDTTGATRPRPVSAGPREPDLPPRDGAPHAQAEVAGSEQGGPPGRGKPAALSEAVAVNGTRSSRLRQLFQVLAGFQILWLLAGLYSLSVFQRLAEGRLVSRADLETFTVWVVVFACLEAVIALVATVMFFRWIYTANKNLTRMGIEKTTFSPGWAVGVWFIPLVNLYRPYQVVKEIWTESYDAAVPPDEADYLHPPPDLDFLRIWWFVHLAAVVAAARSATVGIGAETLPEIEAGTYAGLVRAGLGLANLLATMGVIRKLQSTQLTAASVSILR